MKLLQLTQGSPEWEQYRAERITATDVAAIMGMNPDVTPYQLWQRKLGLSPKIYVTERMQRGSDLEPEALKRYIEETGIPMMPVCVESGELPYVMASLDGISPDLDRGVEIKCPNEEKHAIAIAGYVPDIYIAQLQCQMYVTRLKQWDYYSYDGERGICITVKRDDEFIERMLLAAKEFYEYLSAKNPPPLCERDCVKREEITWKVAVDEWKEAKELLTLAESREEQARNHLITLSEGRSSEGCGIRLRKIVQKGKIDYGSIPELKTVNLEPFRKPPIVKWTITSLK